LTVLLQNFGNKHQTIQPKQQIAQLILEEVSTPPINIVNNLISTSRGTNGFSSTGNIMTPKKMHKIPPANFIFNPIISPSIPTNTMTVAAKLFLDIQTTFEQPYNVNLSFPPYANHCHHTIKIRVSDKDKYYGLSIIICPNRNIPKLIKCKTGTSSICIPRWCSELRDTHITFINDTPIHSMNDINNIFEQIQSTNQDQFKIVFSTITKQANEHHW
jgi:hypothetical protein